jgi:hypothetical protein
LGEIPIPLPKHYVTGLDLQKLDFEEGKWSYLNGEWKLGGWWYYYLEALLLKEPLGSWVLLILAFLVSCIWRKVYSAGWRNELVLLAPAVVVFVLVSSQTGFSRYLRYVLPCFPFVFIWISKLAQSFESRQWKVVAPTIAALVCSVGSSLSVYPYSMSYFNELAGGPKNGHRYLIDANIDWGQDIWHLKRWYDQHRQARPLRGKLHSFVDSNFFEMDLGEPPRGPTPAFPGTDPADVGPQPGWYAMSVHRLHERDGRYDYFLKFFKPTTMIGYSIYIYHIRPEEARRARTAMGLLKLEEAT